MLWVYDPLAFNGQGKVAIAIGNPDYARNTAAIVPGTGSSVAQGWMTGHDDAINLYDQTLAADPYPGERRIGPRPGRRRLRTGSLDRQDHYGDCRNIIGSTGRWRASGSTISCAADECPDALHRGPSLCAFAELWLGGDVVRLPRWVLTRRCE